MRGGPTAPPRLVAFVATPSRTLLVACASALAPGAPASSQSPAPASSWGLRAEYGSATIHEPDHVGWIGALATTRRTRFAEALLWDLRLSLSSGDETFMTLSAGLEVRGPWVVSPVGTAHLGLLSEAEYAGPYIHAGLGVRAQLGRRLAVRGLRQLGWHTEAGPHAWLMGVEWWFGAG